MEESTVHDKNQNILVINIITLITYHEFTYMKSIKTLEFIILNRNSTPCLNNEKFQGQQQR